MDQESKPTRRAERRHERQRLMRNRRVWWGRSLTTAELGQVARTPTPCSCWMCANARALDGPPMRERREPAVSEF